MTEHSPVPLVDLRIQHDQIIDTVMPQIADLFASGAFIRGPQVVSFERAYARYSGVDHCVGVGNGTDAIEMGLRAAGVAPGAEVILPANTFVATAEAVVRAGCRVRLVDCDPEHLLIDAGAARSALSPETGAVIGVDLYGQIAPFEALEDLEVVVLEDGAQSQGARRLGRPAGSFGTVAATSFYPGKNLGAFGDAGAVLTDSAEIAQNVAAIGDHGGNVKYEHRLVGCNSRLDSVQAVVLSAKLQLLDEWNRQRRRAAEVYGDLLGDVDGVRLPSTAAGNDHVWHLYVVRVPGRDAVADVLHSEGIGAGIHYPTPIHLTEAFRSLGHGSGDFPVAEAAAREILTLPLFPGITVPQQERVAEVLAKAVNA